MKTKLSKHLTWGGVLSFSLMALLTGGSVHPAMAQGEDDAYTSRVNEEVSGQEQTREEGPVRLARFRYLKGGVSYRADSEDAWTDATVNTPLREGAQISVTDDDSRVEIQFDDGSILRLGRGALVTLTNLYSDAEGAFTQVKLQDGVASLRLKHDRSVYQVDTPYLTMKAAGPANLRVNVSEDVEVAINSGKALVESSQGEQNLVKGDFLRLSDPEDDLVVRDLPRPDSWDRWNSERDNQFTEGERVARKNLPSNIAIVSQDLDEYGDWRTDAEYGNVWVPRVSSVDWRPYNDGHWSWVNPFGWTWVSNEAWGWAPYHYGSWVHRGFGWGWVPGPVTQCWSPGVVHFSEYSGGVAWVPLAPSEIHYPTRIAIGARFNNWSLYFSIGEAGVYYYDHDGFRPRPWNSTYINRSVIVKNTTIVNNYYRGGRAYTGIPFGYNRNTTVSSSHYIPINARLASGATLANAEGFGRGGYRRGSRSDAGLFGEGRGVGAPRMGEMPASGPSALRPTIDRLPSASRNPVPAVRAMERRTYSAPQARRGGVAQIPTTAEQLQVRRTPGSGSLPRPDRARTTDTGLPTSRTGRTGSTERTTPGIGTDRSPSAGRTPGSGRQGTGGSSTGMPGTPTRQNEVEGRERGPRHETTTGSPGATSGNEPSLPRRNGSRTRTTPSLPGTSSSGTETHGDLSPSRRNRTYGTDRTSSSAEAARSAREALNGTRRGGGVERGSYGSTDRSNGQSGTPSRRSSGTGVDPITGTRSETRTRDRDSLPNPGSGSDRPSRTLPGGSGDRGSIGRERGSSPSSSTGPTGDETTRAGQRVRTPRSSDTGTSTDRTDVYRRDRTSDPGQRSSGYSPRTREGGSSPSSEGGSTAGGRIPRNSDASPTTRSRQGSDPGGMPSSRGAERGSRTSSPTRESRGSGSSDKSSSDKSSKDSGSTPRRKS